MKISNDFAGIPVLLLVLIFLTYIVTTALTPVEAKKLIDEDSQNKKKYTTVYALSVTAAVTSAIVLGTLIWQLRKKDNLADKAMNKISEFCKNAQGEWDTNTTILCSVLLP